MNNEIHINHITKRYGDVEALRDLSLEIGSGELFGLIGPDGAGKTTLFRILTTLLLADSRLCLRLGRGERLEGDPSAGRIYARPLLALPRPDSRGELELLRYGLQYDDRGELRSGTGYL